MGLRNQLKIRFLHTDFIALSKQHFLESRLFLEKRNKEGIL